MRIIQFEKEDGLRCVGKVVQERVYLLNGINTTHELAIKAIEEGRKLSDLVNELSSDNYYNYESLIINNKVLPPIDHSDSAHCIIAGTGLTHLASASARDHMHQCDSKKKTELTPSLQMFQWGLEGGKPVNGKPGAQPEWFYKGDGDVVVKPGGSFRIPEFAKDGGEEPEVVGIYVIGNDGYPYRLGFALGNEATDHIMEKMNYLYLAHSKLRDCSYGPELLIGDLPRHLEGSVRIRRNDEVIWEKQFLTGEDNMCHSISNLEYHHFKYNQFLRPGDVHVQFMGTSVASFADGVRTEDGDVFEIEVPEFGKPLINSISRVKEIVSYGEVKKL